MTNVVLLNRLQLVFSFYEDLLGSVSSSDLNIKLGNLRSNSLGLQIWCVAGARESHAKCIADDVAFA